METTVKTCAVPSCPEPREVGLSFCVGHGPKRRAHTERVRAGKRINDSGVLVCTVCGGSQFKAKRSVGGKLAGGLLAPKSRVQCVTCGATTSRG